MSNERAQMAVIALQSTCATDALINRKSVFCNTRSIIVVHIGAVAEASLPDVADGLLEDTPGLRCEEFCSGLPVGNIRKCVDNIAKTILEYL